MEKKVFLTVACFILLMCLSADLSAQCAMCRATAASSLGSGNSMADGLNTGILYLIAFPYIAIGTVAFLWYRNNKNRKS